MILVGLYSPLPQSGKSTFGKALLDLKEGSKLIKFADGMRQVIVEFMADFFPGGSAEVEEWLQDERKDNALIPELGVTLRHCLQTLGTSWGRVCVHPDLWVLKTRMAIRRAHNSPLVVVDDVRMPNEFWMMRKLGATVIRVFRPDAPPTPTHQSNQQLEECMFDYRVTNDTCPTELCMQARRIGAELGLVDAQ